MPAVVPIITTAVVKTAAFFGASGLTQIAVGNVVAGALTSASFWLATASITYSSIEQRKAARAAKAALNRGRVFQFFSPTAPRQIVYGQVRTSGPVVFAESSGTNKEYMHLIIALAGHECEEITTVYINDEALTLDGSGNVTSGTYNGLVRVKKHLGTTSQTADSDLVSEASSWTTDHRLRGICYVYVRLKWNAEVFGSDRPNISALVKGKKVYDPRTTSTAYSNNWALCLADYLTDSSLGVGHAYADLDDTALQAAANIADEDVTLVDLSTEKRYTVNGVILSDAAPGDVVQQLVYAGAGFCGFIGGKWHIHAGAYRTPTITLDENDLRGPISVQTKMSRRDIFNAGKGVFTSPDNNWQPADYPAITNATYQTEDGERIWRDFEWPFTTSNATAQRLTKIALERVRQEITVQLRCKLTAIRVQAGDNVMLTNTRFGWSSKVFEVVTSTLVPEEQDDGAMALGVDLQLKETASGVWDWADGEETEIDLAPNTNLPDPRTVAAPTSLLLASGSTELYQQVDGTVIPRIKATWTVPADQFVQSGGLIRMEFKKSAASTWIPWTVLRGDLTEEYITDVEDGVAYDVRIRSENYAAAVSSWVSDSITVGQKTSAPTAPSNVTTRGPTLTDSVPIQYSTTTGGISYATIVTWDSPADIDVVAVELSLQSGTSSPSSGGSKPTSGLYTPEQGEKGVPYYLDNPSFLSSSVWARFWDASGNSSSWSYEGTTANWSASYSGNITQQDADDVNVTGISTGDGSSVQKILAVYAPNPVISLTGGSPSETFTVDLTNRGFSTKPDTGLIQCMTDANIVGYYDFDNASNTSTTAYFYVETRDGTNLPSGYQRFSIQVIEYD